MSISRTPQRYGNSIRWHLKRRIGKERRREESGFPFPSQADVV